jgi:hypothetical protein
VKSDYIVTLSATVTRVLCVPECNSPEEAEAIAEDMFNDDPTIGETVDSELNDVQATLDTGEDVTSD